MAERLFRSKLSSIAWLLPGSRWLATFAGDDQWDHERIMLWPVSTDRWVIVSPHGDLYDEKFSGYTRLRRLTSSKRYPTSEKTVCFEEALGTVALCEKIAEGRTEALRIRAAEGLVDGFAEPTGAISWDGAAMTLPAVPSGLGAALRRFRGKQPPRVSTGGPVRLPLSDGSDTEVATRVKATDKFRPKEGFLWLAADLERHSGPRAFVYGSEVALRDGDSVFGEKALHVVDSGEVVFCEQVRVEDAPGFLALRRRLFGARGQADDDRTPREGEAAQRADKGDLSLGGGALNVSVPTEPEGEEDIRTCWIDYDSQGQRYKEWRSVIAEASTQRFADSPLPGAATALHTCKSMLRLGGCPKLWFREWCREKGITKASRSYHELKCLVDTLEIAGSFDQLNVGASVALENLVRRLLAIVEAHDRDADNPNWSLAAEITGESHIGDLMSFELRGEVQRTAKEKLEREAFRDRARTAASTRSSLDGGGVEQALATGGLPSGGGAAKSGARGGKGGRGRGDRPAPGRGG